MTDLESGALQNALTRQFKEVKGFLKDSPYIIPIQPSSMHWSMARCKGCYYQECDNTYHLIALSLAQVIEGIAVVVEPVFLNLKKHPEAIVVIIRAIALLETAPWQYAAGVLSNELGENVLLDKYVKTIDPLIECLIQLVVNTSTGKEATMLSDLDKLNKRLCKTAKLAREWATKPESDLGPVEWFKAYDNWRSIWINVASEGSWSWPPKPEFQKEVPF
jgi:hypothetical protein